MFNWWTQVLSSDAPWILSIAAFTRKLSRLEEGLFPKLEQKMLSECEDALIQEQLQKHKSKETNSTNKTKIEDSSLDMEYFH